MQLKSSGDTPGTEELKMNDMGFFDKEKEPEVLKRNTVMTIPEVVRILDMKATS